MAAACSFPGERGTPARICHMVDGLAQCGHGELPLTPHILTSAPGAFAGQLFDAVLQWLLEAGRALGRPDGSRRPGRVAVEIPEITMLRMKEESAFA